MSDPVDNVGGPRAFPEFDDDHRTCEHCGMEWLARATRFVAGVAVVVGLCVAVWAAVEALS